MDVEGILLDSDLPPKKLNLKEDVFNEVAISVDMSMSQENNCIHEEMSESPEGKPF